MQSAAIQLTAFSFLCLAFDASAALLCEPPDKDRLSETKGLEDICEGKDTSKRIETLPGGTLEVVVCSREYWNATGFDVEPNGRYRLRVVARDNWNDWGSAANANGWIERSWFVDKFGSWAKRHDGADWFALIASVGRDAQTYTAIGAGSSCITDSGGEIHLFANDARGFYWNNRGALKVRIEPLHNDEDPGPARIE